MISRVADHAFWLGRYVERTESTARLLATTHSLALDGELEPAACWRPVVVVAGEEPHYATRAAGEPSAWGDGDRIETFLAIDPEVPASIVQSIAAARDNARSIREVVSLEAWECLNELYLWSTSDGARREFTERRFAFYRRVRDATQLALGLMRSTMLHDEPLDFIWLGVMLERVSQTARILDVQHHAYTSTPSRHEVIATSLWLSLLRSLSGYEPFMKQSRGKVDAEAVARFLIREARFPRAIAFCVHAAYQRLAAIRPPEADDLPGGATLTRLRALDELIARGHGALRGAAVHELLTLVVDETHAICDSLGKELLGNA
ncbi:MAG: alpha-E domain-containing protein [Myxococcales bacterium]|nr:alpha-E domain-containing protein [Myxococcales bacterium]